MSGSFTVSSSELSWREKGSAGSHGTELSIYTYCSHFSFQRVSLFMHKRRDSAIL